MLPLINPAKEIERLTTFIRTTVHSRGFHCGVIAVSGGVDSATSLFLAVKALGKQNVFILILPYGRQSVTATKDAGSTIAAVKIPLAQSELVDIKPIVDTFANKLSLVAPSSPEQIRLGNVMARCRMIVLYDRAKKHKALVVGTENKSEHYLSYFTRFGDEASDIEPIKHLYKTQVYELARYLGVPEVILKKTPTAGLWSGQTDEGQFGFTYATADQILHGLYDRKLSVKQLIKRGFSELEIKKVQVWVKQNWFKHELPIVYKDTNYPKSRNKI